VSAQSFDACAARERCDVASTRACRARAFRGNHPREPFRAMIARPNIRRNERRAAEVGAFDVGRVALVRRAVRRVVGDLRVEAEDGQHVEELAEAQAGLAAGEVRERGREDVVVADEELADAVVAQELADEGRVGADLAQVHVLGGLRDAGPEEPLELAAALEAAPVLRRARDVDARRRPGLAGVAGRVVAARGAARRRGVPGRRGRGAAAAAARRRGRARARGRGRRAAGPPARGARGGARRPRARRRRRAAVAAVDAGAAVRGDGREQLLEAAEADLRASRPPVSDVPTRL